MMEASTPLHPIFINLTFTIGYSIYVKKEKYKIESTVGNM